MRLQVPIRLLAALTLVLVGGGTASAATVDPTTGVQLRTLSNRADLISGGDALLEVELTAPATGLKVAVGTRDVTSAFTATDPLHYVGLVDGLALGPNVVTATTADGSGARLIVLNHDRRGPVFSGPPIQPWYCLPGALDAQCSRPTKYTYTYKSSTTNQMAAYDPANPPSDVANVTTDQGKTVPYVVRTESGTMDRSAYSISVLYDGSAPIDRRTGPPAWNHKVYVTHGGGCAGMHTEGVAPGTMNGATLTRGFLVMSTALDDSNQNCSVVVQAESILMAKEHIAEQYGDIRYTIGMGSSGGSLAALQMSNAYPGLYDGLTVASTFPDATYTDLLDCAILHRYFDAPQKWAPGVVWTEAQMAAATGKQTTSVCRVVSLPFGPEGYANFFNPSDPQWCNMGSHEPERVYKATTNPTGVRCAFQDYMVNIFGTREPAQWGAVERSIGKGFAGRPYDTVGVMYGLRALQAGLITKAQFVDLNTKVGAIDIDYGTQATRVAADPFALDAAYRSGVVDEANHLDQVPIIDIPNPGNNYDIHDKYKSWALRARLDKANGHHDNHLIWYGPYQLGLAANADDGNAFLLMDRWLTAIEADHRDVPREQKVRDNKPADAKDRCELPTQEVCNAVMAPYGSTRMAAGDGPATDIMKCRLKPIVASDFAPILFTDAELNALKATFPSGICDWDRPGVSQQHTTAWQTYENKVGGEPLGAPPLSVPFNDPAPVVPEVPLALALPLLAAVVLALGLRARSAR